MGSYSYGEFLDMFGGEPDPDEYVRDWRSEVDARRKAEREEPTPELPPALAVAHAQFPGQALIRCSCGAWHPIGPCEYASAE